MVHDTEEGGRQCRSPQASSPHLLSLEDPPKEPLQFTLQKPSCDLQVALQKRWKGDWRSTGTVRAACQGAIFLALANTGRSGSGNHTVS